MALSFNNGSNELQVGQSNEVSSDLAVNWLDGGSRVVRLKSSGQSTTQDHTLIPTSANTGIFFFGFPIAPNILLPAAPAEEAHVVTI